MAYIKQDTVIDTAAQNRNRYPYVENDLEKFKLFQMSPVVYSAVI